MRQEGILKVGMVFLFLILTLSFVSAAMRSTPQYAQYMTAQTGEFDKSMCQQGQDFIIQISPFGCTPAVVRSDLLEEENVPVFCQLGATKINPLIDVEAIESISFSGEYPPEVEGIAFHPARAALGVGGNLNNPILNNIGYVVVVLKRQPDTSKMPKFVSGNLTARIKYDVKNGFGIGKANFYLPEMTDSEWERVSNQYSFWNGKGTLRAESIGADRAVISVYSNDNKLQSVSLKKGEESGKIYLPGFDCLASLQVKLNSLENPDTRARLRVNAEVVEVAEGEKFLENKCRVLNRGIDKQGLVQKVKIECREDDGTNTLELEIQPRVTLKIGDKEPKSYKMGDIIHTFEGNERKRIFLGYIGENSDEEYFIVPVISPERDSEEFLDSFIVKKLPLFIKSFDSIKGGRGIIGVIGGIVAAEASMITIIATAIATGSYPLAMYAKGKETDTLVDFSKLFPNMSLFTIPEIEFVDFTEPQDISLEGEIEEYYGLAVDDYETIGESFAGEKNVDNPKQNLDEEALSQQIILAENTQQKATVVELCDEFKSSYPDSNEPAECDSDYKLSNQERSVGYVTINGELKKITFDGIYEPSLEDYSAEIFVSKAGDYNGEKIFQKNEERQISEKDSMILKELEEDYAIFDVTGIDHGVWKELYDPKNLKIELGDYEFVGKNGYKISLEKINLKKSAKVTLSPGFENDGTEASFGFNIGIEQRAIKLSPAKIKEKIENLDNSIEKWQGFSEGLGKVVKGLKTACLATGAALTVKNFLANTGGRGIARKYVMRGKDGWYEKCAEITNENPSISMDKCLFDNADKIDKDVEDLTDVIGEQNKIIKDLEKNNVKEVLGKKVSNTSEVMRKYSERVAANIEDEDMKKILSYDSWKNRNYNREQLREIDLWSQILKDDGVSGELRAKAEKERESVYSDIRVNAGNYADIVSWASGLNVASEDIGFIEIGENAKELTYRGLTNKDIGNKIRKVEGDVPVALLQASDGKKFILVLDRTAGTDKLPIQRTDKDFPDTEIYIRQNYKTYNNCVRGVGDLLALAEATCQRLFLGESEDIMIYDSDGKLAENVPDEIKNVYFREYDASTYENQYKNAEVHFYETEPYKGLPAIVPFDLKQGWYAATKQTLPVFGNIAAYEKSGRVSSFYLCNVGENGLEDNVGGDDICQMINLGTGQPYDQFYGLETKEASKLVGCAIDAINSASRYKSGRMVKITTSRCGNVNVAVGKPAVDIPEIECADLMSPRDCKLLFNLCDPVICPSSRCDLGGAYPVRDVIQSGIVGSLALCLPNFPEVKIPVCLTGVQAGIDSWLSVKNSYKDCLQNALDTGEMVGICDEIYSIHLCEFFWRQALPFADLAIPAIVSRLMGQNARGGGEYLSVENAWSTAGDSITYFTQYYGANANRAFKARTSEEVGTEVCRLSISGVFASGSNLIDTLTDPDSPSQFHGRFDEIPFSSVTVPPTSHYKVFYHIFAGKDSGAYYQVYLKSAPGSSYYQDTASTLMIASGYIATGGYVTDTPDLTATSGYKEMCINVNGQEECGFKEVSTSFAVDYLSDQYVASQLEETNIKTEKECISGSASAYNVLSNPNLQEGVGDLISPEIYNQGIIRICATGDPGKGSDSYAGTESSRWKEVGYCGSENIKCWLDTSNIKDIIEGTKIAEDVLEDVRENYLDILRNRDGYLSEKEFASKVKEIGQKDKDASERLILIEEIFNKVFLNSEKGYLHLLRGNAYADLARRAIGELGEGKTEGDENGEGDEIDEEGDDEEKAELGEEEEELEVSANEFVEYVERYDKSKDFFEKYAKENLPDGWTENEFKSLLVAIAIRQSNLGYPDGEYDPRWIMEFGWKGGERISQYVCNEGGTVSEEEMIRCAKVQIDKASHTLKLGLNKREGLTDYKECNGKIFATNHLTCILSVYYTGQKSRFFGSSEGKVFARETIEFMKVAEDYFENEDEYRSEKKESSASSLDIEKLSESVVKLEFDAGLGGMDFVINEEGIPVFTMAWESEGTGFLVEDRASTAHLGILSVLHVQPEEALWFDSTFTLPGDSETYLFTVKFEKNAERDLLFRGVAFLFREGSDPYRDTPEGRAAHAAETYYPFLSLGDSDDVDIGDEIFILGYPDGSSTVQKRQGRVSNIEKDFSVSVEDGADHELYFPTLIIVDARVEEGMSGSPAFNSDGEVVGIVFAVRLKDDMTMVIPINEAKTSFPDRVSYNENSGTRESLNEEAEETIVPESNTDNTEIVTSTTTTSSETITFTSPIFKYKERNIFRSDLFYKYINNEWYWSADQTNWMTPKEFIVKGGTFNEEEPSEANKEFITKLQGKNYERGLKELIDRTMEERSFFIIPKALSTKNADMNSNEQFIFRHYYSARVSPLVFSFRFSNNEWEWTTEYSSGKWFSGSRGAGFYNAPAELIDSLDERNFYEGAKIIFSD